MHCSSGVGVSCVLEVSGRAVVLALLEVHDGALGIGKLGDSEEVIHGLTVSGSKSQLCFGREGEASEAHRGKPLVCSAQERESATTLYRP